MHFVTKTPFKSRLLKAIIIDLDLFYCYGHIQQNAHIYFLNAKGLEKMMTSPPFTSSTDNMIAHFYSFLHSGLLQELLSNLQMVTVYTWTGQEFII
jgi:hypothetical protein